MKYKVKFPPIPQRPESRISENAFEILRFVCLSVLAFAAISAFALTNVEITPNAPIGLIVKPVTLTSNIQNSTLAGGQWMLNIGGSVNDGYSSGIQVPVNVIIFGIAGGYLRYLYDTARKYKPSQEPVKSEHTVQTVNKETPSSRTDKEEQIGISDERGQVFYESLRDIALFFLSPLLAIALWLVLLQGGTTSIYTLAAISFATGLVTREVVEAIVGFVTKFTSSPKT